jgi:hypothetical protein
MFVQIPAQAQVTVDVSKITCDQLLMEKSVPAKYVVLWFSGYYNGKRNHTIIEPEAMDQTSRRLTSIATTIAKRLLWTPSRTCSVWRNEEPPQPGVSAMS